MLPLLADENFNGRIVRALQRRTPGLDLLRVQDTRLSGADDRELLDWAATAGRVLVTHDVATLVGYALERVREGRPMPGVIAARSTAPLGRIVEDLHLLVETVEPSELEGQVIFLPM